MDSDRRDTAEETFESLDKSEGPRRAFVSEPRIIDPDRMFDYYIEAFNEYRHYTVEHLRIMAERLQFYYVEMVSRGAALSFPEDRMTRDREFTIGQYYGMKASAAREGLRDLEDESNHGQAPPKKHDSTQRGRFKSLQDRLGGSDAYRYAWEMIGAYDSLENPTWERFWERLATDKVDAKKWKHNQKTVANRVRLLEREGEIDETWERGDLHSFIQILKKLTQLGGFRE